MKSAIGEGMTRKDHADVSNQLVRMITVRPRLSEPRWPSSKMVFFR